MDWLSRDHTEALECQCSRNTHSLLLSPSGCEPWCLLCSISGLGSELDKFVCVLCPISGLAMFITEGRKEKAPIPLGTSERRAQNLPFTVGVRSCSGYTGGPSQVFSNPVLGKLPVEKHPHPLQWQCQAPLYFIRGLLPETSLSAVYHSPSGSIVCKTLRIHTRIRNWVSHLWQQPCV